MPEQPKFEAPAGLGESERQAITLTADQRTRQLELKIMALNIEQTSKMERDEVKKTIARESSGETEEKFSKEQAQEKVPDLVFEAEQLADYLPVKAAYNCAQTAKILQLAGFSFDEYLNKAGEYGEKAKKTLPQISPASLLPDAIMIGVNSRELKGLAIPKSAEVAVVAAADPKLLSEYALVLPEEERDEFLNKIPAAQRRRASVMLDRAVSKVLHSAVIEKGTPEEKQRKAVRLRVFHELKETIASRKSEDRKIALHLSEAMRLLGTDSKDFLVEILRDELEDRKFVAPEKLSMDHLPRAVKVLLEEFEDFRGNDLALKLAADERIHPNLSIWIFKKLVDNHYLEKDLEDWWNERRSQMLRKGRKEENQDKLYRLDILRKIVSDLGVVPNRAVVEFIADESKWKDDGEVLDVSQRFSKIKESKTKFEGITNNSEMVSILRKDQTTAMTYYLLYGGNDRFDLINNYDFNKFWEILGMIDDLKINERPIKAFDRALTNSGNSPEQAKKIIKRLRTGHYPLDREEDAYQEVSFEISENAALKNANEQIGQVMGREQLGVVLLGPTYREILQAENSDKAKEYVEKLNQATTFVDRLAVITKIESEFPDIQEQAKEQLTEPWIQLGEKMLLEMSLDQVFNDSSVPIRGQELLPKLDAKRIDLKRIKKEILVLLKGENIQLKNIQKRILKFRKARTGLEIGLEKQEKEAARKKLESKIAKINEQMQELEEKKESLAQQMVSERFAHLSEAEKKAEIDKVSQEIMALTEKDPSAIFTYILMQVLDEEKLKESDLSLIKEMESHLQGPIQTIKDIATFQRPKEEKKLQRLGLKYLDKTERLMNMVRFADSKICCFSSSNYEMVVSHEIPNKFWVASINKDPLSFVISLEIPQDQVPAEAGKQKVHENLGFIFGSYAMDDNEQLGIMLNGIYYAPGIEKDEHTELMLEAVKKIFEGMKVKTFGFATQYGGSVPIPKKYSNESIELTRLRAIDDGYGNPEDKIYDDMATGSDLNKEHVYGGNFWHKRL